ncbi:Pre-mRNA-processing factor 19 [Erysiphe neolycopersici]|uniref:Pre-mRNA-processing factor 19 n=1 Tax=Erysiphe neolycopersici TaxID=212602 RepID=A0A420HPY7_9PEZI|nr:Pre-mRNA-processing factor 19 [Erysiphe neolycopersici]
MLCSISGEVPQQAVASSKSGNIFEKRLITAYIAENHKDPVNGEDLEIEDLIDLKSARIAIPRPPTLTSIPSLLSTFQNEWDALALETFTLRQHLQQTRQELATALYQHDAAVRVIARLTKERDQAREALSKIKISTNGVNNEDSMQIDPQGLPLELCTKVDETQERLSKTRRKRPLPADWADFETIGLFETSFTSEPLYSNTTFLAIHDTTQLAIIGGNEGVVGIYSIAENKIQQSMEIGYPITNGIWFADHPVISTSSGLVKVLGIDELSFNLHNGSANHLALHPCGDILASVGADKSFVLYDLAGKKSVCQIFTDSELVTVAFHPDGHLLAVGGMDGQIKLFHIKTFENAANFALDGPIQDLTFSENGIWFSAVAKKSSHITIFDLRKEGKAAEAKVLEIEGHANCIRWDYTGQYLAACGSKDISIFKYIKTSKAWSIKITFEVPATALVWGPGAKSLVTISSDGIIKLLK